MDWPEELVKLEKAISTEHGNRIFKSILSDVLDYDSHLTELKDLRIKILAIESSLPPETSVHYLLQISQQLNTLSADVTQKFEALARIEHQLAQKIVAIEQKVAVLELHILSFYILFVQIALFMFTSSILHILYIILHYIL